MGAPTAPAICTRSLRSRRPRRSSLNVEPASSWSTQEVASQPERSIEHLAYACRCPTTTRGPGRSAQAQGCIPQMWVIASFRRRLQPTHYPGTHPIVASASTRYAARLCPLPRHHVGERAVEQALEVLDRARTARGGRGIPSRLAGRRARGGYMRPPVPQAVARALVGHERQDRRRLPVDLRPRRPERLAV